MKAVSTALKAMIIATLDRYKLPCNEAVTRLLLMIAAHESGGFLYARQINGPALGLFQMEPPTFQEAVGYLRRRQERYPALAMDTALSTAEDLVLETWLAICMARLYLVRFPEPLPDADDLCGLAVYAKKYWNTEAGKATAADYLNAYKRYCT